MEKFTSVLKNSKKRGRSFKEEKPKIKGDIELKKMLLDNNNGVLLTTVYTITSAIHLLERVNSFLEYPIEESLFVTYYSRRSLRLRNDFLYQRLKFYVKSIFMEV